MQRLLSFSIGVFASLLSYQSIAGITGENVIVVVNAKSVDSMTVANHYGYLRSIPDSHFVYLDEVPSGLICDFATFKEKILLPVLSTIEKRKISGQTKVIAYSTGFPTTVETKEFSSTLKDPTLKKIQGQPGSLTGLTYLYQFVLADNSGFLSLHSNTYARGPFERHFANPFPSADPNTWAEAEQLDAEEKHAEAGTRWISFFQANSTQAPAAILAAKSFARSGEDAKAIQSLLLAIQSGWRSKSIFSDDETLKNLLQRNTKTNGVSSLRLEQLDDLPAVTQHPVAFSSQIPWSANGWPSKDPKKGMRYLPSCMLGVIDPRASTLEQVLKVLTTSAESDHSFPDAGFQFTNTRDIRSKTRLPRAVEAVLLLNSLGKDATLISRTVPGEEVRLAGLMLGAPLIPPTNLMWSLVPGSISENLTSCACNFRSKSQTKSTVLLHRGASLTCGPVAEPYAIAEKFPDPMMYTHYVRGATGIEAIYLSVASPYQTLVIGDPLVCAFAELPPENLSITSDLSGAAAIIELRHNVIEKSTMQASHLAIYIEGRLTQRVAAEKAIGRRIRMDGTGSLKGYVEVRVASESGTPLRTRRMKASEIDFGNLGSRIKVEIQDQTIHVQCDQATKIQVMSRRRTLAKIEGGSCDVTLDAKRVGEGPVRIRVLATIDGERVASKSVFVNVIDRVDPIIKP